MSGESEVRALAQVIANSFFAMEAGESPEEGGYPLPEINSGHLNLAFDILMAGYGLVGDKWENGIDSLYGDGVHADPRPLEEVQRYAKNFRHPARKVYRRRIGPWEELK